MNDFNTWTPVFLLRCLLYGCVCTQTMKYHTITLWTALHMTSCWITHSFPTTQIPVVTSVRGGNWTVEKEDMLLCNHAGFLFCFVFIFYTLAMELKQGTWLGTSAFFGTWVTPHWRASGRRAGVPSKPPSVSLTVRCVCGVHSNFWRARSRGESDTADIRISLLPYCMYTLCHIKASSCFWFTPLFFLNVQEPNAHIQKIRVHYLLSWHSNMQPSGITSSYLAA